MLVGLMHNSTTAKEQKNAQLILSEMSVKVSFVTPGMEKIEKKAEDFLFLPIDNVIGLEPPVMIRPSALGCLKIIKNTSTAVIFLNSLNHEIW